MLVDRYTNSIIFVGPDRSTVRSMSPDGSQRAIIHKTGKTIPGGIAYNSQEKVLFYIARSVRPPDPMFLRFPVKLFPDEIFMRQEGIARLKNGQRAPTDFVDIPHALWMAFPNSPRRSVKLLDNLWTCRAVAYDPMSRVVFISNYVRHSCCSPKFLIEFFLTYCWYGVDNRHCVWIIRI